MALIGLTGGPGAGKSLAAYYLKRKGAAVISGDDIGREVISAFPVVLKRLAKEFGKEILNPDGSFDRKKTGQLVFGDPRALKKLNSIVHPYLLKLLKAKIRKSVAKSARRIVIVDAALIYEWGIEDWFDAILVVTSNRDIRIKRLVSGGLTRSEAVGRMNSQIPQREKAARADYVIENNGRKIALRNRIYGFLNMVKTDFGN